MHQLTMTLLRALLMLSIAEKDAILLVGQRSTIVPALIVVLRRMASRIWGISMADFDLRK